ncbi:putative two-component response regulator transcription regulator protein [Frankia canadensis]|uniref:Putative two-component response regulator transcription regulator protein n=1 Tax=Frankia canadensis TaxID=1836972 RepID=A0A2I2KJW4_9ACTN|nr:response regulator transcription factor [Frankia canadensis]SNQ45937.1 putative two-component response regulator transcription regulator protein [Frankia canadensis]SOU53227.1 putative two-component response regulator transcription regulator protein [Frankia canadensis]
MRICVVDDHEVVREGLRLALSATADLDIEIVAEAGSGHEALAALRRFRPDLMLVDYRLPDTPGDRLCADLVAAHRGIKVVMLTSYLSEDVVQRCLAAGAAGFVTKAAGLDELRTVLGRIASGGDGLVVCSTSATVQRLYSAATAPDRRRLLTPQQERVLELAAEGCTYGEIGKRLNLSVSTVRFHIRGVKERLGVKTHSQLIATAIREALIAPGSDAVSA